MHICAEVAVSYIVQYMPFYLMSGCVFSFMFVQQCFLLKIFHATLQATLQYNTIIIKY